METIDAIDKEIDALIAKWNKALFEESEAREFAFTDAVIHLQGIKCRQLTLRHYQTLDFLNSIFIKGTSAEITADEVVKHIINFLWVVSADYIPYDQDALAAFTAKVIVKIQECGIEKLQKEIMEYLSKALLDIPQVEPEPPKLKSPTTAYCAGIVDLLAAEYHWTDDRILDMPIARLYQYVRCIEERKARDAGSNIRLRNPITSPIEEEIMRLDEKKNALIGEQTNGQSK